MPREWRELTELTQGREMVVERVRLVDGGIVIEGEFELPALAALTADDQVFVAAFVRCHGSIKQMEKLFGVSYPTVKNRLNRLGEHLGLVEIDQGLRPGDVLDRLERGEIDASEALEDLTP